MPLIQAGELRLRYELAGPAGAPVVVLSHSLGSDLSMWDPQRPALEASLRVLRYDLRGHGQSTVRPGPCTIADHGGDVVHLLEALGLERVHFCGLSIGGLIGMWLGAHAPERITKLVLSNTAPRIGTQETWNARIEKVRSEGMAAVAPAVVERWFTPEFREQKPEVVAGARRTLEATSPEGYAASCAAVRDADARSELGAIRAPTLVIAGSRDPATPAADGRALAGSIPGAAFVELPASHLSNLEASASFNAELVRFLAA